MASVTPVPAAAIAAPAAQKRLQSPEALLAWLELVVQKAKRDCFYGKLSVHMEGGRIVRVVKEQALVPGDPP